MKRLIFMCLFCLVWAHAGCNDDNTKDYLNTQNSGCLGSALRQEFHDGGLEESFEWAYDSAASTLNVTHYNVVFNCCPTEIRSWAEIDPESGTIELWEEQYFETDDRCGCDCRFNVTTPIPNVVPGAYHLTVFTDDRLSYAEDIQAQ